MAKYKKRITSGYGIETPLPDLFPSPILADRSPTTADNGYPQGQVWINKNSASADFNDIWILTSVAAGLANWEPIGNDTGGAAPITKYVVDPDGTGDYTTIQGAINAVQASTNTTAMIFVRPSATPYTENLTLYDGLIIRGDNIQTTITGVHTPPASGAVIFMDLYLTSATDVITSAAAGTTRLRFFDCTFNCTNGYVVDCANWTGPVDFHSCHTASTADGVVRVGASTVTIENSYVGAGANALSITGGTLTIRGSRIGCPVSPAGANAGSITEGSFISGTVTLAGTSAMSIANSTLSTGANAAITQSSAGALTLTDTTITSVAAPCIAGAGAGAVTLSNVNFTSNSALDATLTRAYVAETKNTKTTCGDSTYRVNAFSGDSNVMSVYCDDATATGANYNKAIRGDMTVSSGDGTDSPQAIRGELTHLTGSHHEEGYGGYYLAQQDDGSQIDSNLIGLLGAVSSLETDAGDTPQQWTFGLQGILFGADTGAVFGAGLQAGVASYVTYNTCWNDVGHGFLASRNGGGAGGTAAAAYKVEAGSAIISDWDIGLDLYNGATGLAYATADIRLWNQTTVLSAATDVTTTYPDTVEALFVMTDSENFQVANTVDGTFASAIEAIEGNFTADSGASILQINGVFGYATQADGSAITSTASGVEGQLHLLETDNADLPPVYAFAVKGYLTGLDATGIPGGITAGVGSVVEYITPFNAKAYGVAVTRLDSYGGTGTAGAAAFGVLQGTVAAADWLYGISFAGSTNGFTNADIQFQNSSTLASDTTGAVFSGDVAGRSFNPTNTNIESFDVDPIIQSNANTGAVASGATGDINVLYLQDRTTVKSFVLGAGQTILKPVLEDDGLLISLDLANSEGQEIWWGHTTRSRHVFTIGTSPAFFIEAEFKVADCGTSDPLWIGFRNLVAPNANYTTYTDSYVIGLRNTTGADTTVIGTNLNNAGWAYQDTGDAWLDGESHVLRIDVSAAGVVTALIDGVAPTTPVAFTFDDTDQICPYIHHLFAAAGSPAAIHLKSLKCGYSAWA